MHLKHSNCFQELELTKKKLLVDKDHPHKVALKIIEKYGDDLDFEFGKYIYTENTIKDNREFINIKSGEMSADNINHLINSLKPGHELALHSRILTQNGSILHIPMIDFCGRLYPNAWEYMRHRIQTEIAQEMIFFDSGSSYHGYSTRLISPKEWYKFMGNILLLNTSVGPQIIDSRWVGHRLLGGFGSLRWSCNACQYKKVPNYISKNDLFSINNSD